MVRCCRHGRKAESRRRPIWCKEPPGRHLKPCCAGGDQSPYHKELRRSALEEGSGECGSGEQGARMSHFLHPFLKPAFGSSGPFDLIPSSHSPLLFFRMPLLLLILQRPAPLRSLPGRPMSSPPLVPSRTRSHQRVLLAAPEAALPTNQRRKS
jgi:hypothetical protein